MTTCTLPTLRRAMCSGRLLAAALAGETVFSDDPAATKLTRHRHPRPARRVDGRAAPQARSPHYHAKDASGKYHQRLIALASRQWAAIVRRPRRPSRATYPGTGAEQHRIECGFRSWPNKERTGLLLLNGVVYTRGLRIATSIL